MTQPTLNVIPAGCHLAMDWTDVWNPIPHIVCDKPKPKAPAGGGATSPSQGANTGASAHSWLVQLAIEVVACAVLIMLAGTSQRGANIAAAITAMLWILWLMNHYG